MVRAPSIDQNGVKKGAWSEEEDNKLRAYVRRYGHWNWRQLPKFAGLSRCGKSCRLRWMNYLRPGVRRGNYSPQEEDLILELHRQFGSKWSLIAAKLPGRVDNDIKNHWNSHLRRKMKLKEQTDRDVTNHEVDSDSSAMSDYNVSSFSDDSTLVLQDCAADNQDSPNASNMEHSFWPQSTDGNDNLLHLQFPAASEEEIMGPFACYLDGINNDCWLHELLQFEY